MMMHKRARMVVWSGIAATLMLAAGCSTYSAAPKRYSGSGVEIDLPAGWLKYNKATDLTITRDGLRLEQVVIRTTRVGSKVEGSERVYNASMMPHEVADLSVGLIKTRPGIRSFDVEKIDAVPMAGKDGYRVDAVYVDEGGLRKRMRIHGAILGDHVCELLYEGADPVYFRKHEGTFQSIVGSVKVRG